MSSHPDEPAVGARLDELAATSAVAFSENARARLLAYSELLLDWNRSINLTGARSSHELVNEHFPDAFAIAARLQPGVGTENGEGGGIADVGSGGGLPAVALSILLPTRKIFMFEPIGKKVAFLRTAIRKLGLGDRLQVAPRRIALPLEPDLEGAFGVAVSRATLPPPDWLALAWHLVRPGGRVFALTTRRLEQWPAELELAHAAPDQRRTDRWLNELRRST